MVLVTDNQYCEKLLNTLWKQAKDGIGTDTVLHFEGAEANVHSCVLRLVSPIMMDKLKIGHQEEGTSIEDPHLANGGELFQAVLEFLYTGRIDVPEESFEKVESFAKFYEIKNLFEICKIYRAEQNEEIDVDVEEAVTVFIDSNEYQSNASRLGWPRKFACMECHEAFDDSTQLSEHYYSCHRNSQPCKDGRSELHGTAIKEQHQDLADRSKNSVSVPMQVEDSCSYCLTPCGSPDSLTEHEKQHKCEKCNKVFDTVEACSAHPCKPYNDKTLYECSKCRKTYISRQCFINHQKLHNGSSHLICKYCGKTFVHYLPLKKHLQSHTDGAAFKHQCQVCGEKFRLQVKFYNHCIKLGHMLNEVPYKCKTCWSSFSTERDLNAHSRVHGPAKPFQCGECEKTYNSRLGLKLHINSIHLKELSYQCGDCGKQFSQKSHLTDHTRVHTKEKRHVCSFCGLAVASKMNLRRHESLHTGQLQLICAICSKKFAIPHDLKRHLKTHHPNFCSVSTGKPAGEASVKLENS